MADPKDSSSFSEPDPSDISGDGSREPLDDRLDRDPVSPRGTEDSYRSAPGASAEEMEELRRILLGGELDKESQLKKRIDQVARFGEAGQIETMSKALPEAIRLHNETDSTSLANALMPTVEKTLGTSVRRNPRPIVDAIFPVIGPAIRRSIRETLAAMLETVNRVLEHSISLKSIRWRLEAWRSGTSFAEVIMAHTLEYSVEQLFLIHRKSGLLITHVHENTAVIRDGDVISGMLKAVQEFVRDSLGLDRGAMLEALEIDGRRIYVVPGPHAILAAVVRGIPGDEVKEQLREIIEALHLQYGHVLESYDGDSSVVEAMAPILQTGMVARYRSEHSERRPVGAWILAGLIGALLLTWLGFRVTEHHRWNRYLEVLREAPGIMVVDAARQGGTWRIQGMHDPYAPHPDSLLDGLFSTDRVQSTWQPYVALDDVSILRRVAKRTRAPESISFTLERDTVFARGEASAAWIREARERIPFFEGIQGYDDRDVTPAGASVAEEAIAYIEQTSIRFALGSPVIRPDWAETLRRVSDAIQDLTSDAEQQITVTVYGYTSTEGTETRNLLLSQQRADAVREALVAHGIPRDVLQAVGTGGTRLPGIERTEAERTANRSVTFSVTRS